MASLNPNSKYNFSQKLLKIFNTRSLLEEFPISIAFRFVPPEMKIQFAEFNRQCLYVLGLESFHIQVVGFLDADVSGYEQLHSETQALFPHKLFNCKSALDSL